MLIKSIFNIFLNCLSLLKPKNSKTAIRIQKCPDKNQDAKKSLYTEVYRLLSEQHNTNSHFKDLGCERFPHKEWKTSNMDYLP
mgnify:CR=1 FL=1